MAKIKLNQTAIVLLEEKNDNHFFIKKWLSEKSLKTNEFIDLVEVMEEMSDFTNRSRPDVILLKVKSLKQDFYKLKKMMRFFGGNTTFPVFAVSESEKVINDAYCFEGNLVEIKFQIEKLLTVVSKQLKFSLST